MFALKENGMALCLESYKRVQKGALVPASNELYEDVESWLKANKGKWASLPVEPVVDLEALRLKEVESNRLKAYADPITGSDRYLTEAMRLESIGSTEEAVLARQKAVERYEEIKAENPW